MTVIRLKSKINSIQQKLLIKVFKKLFVLGQNFYELRPLFYIILQSLSARTNKHSECKPYSIASSHPAKRCKFETLHYISLFVIFSFAILSAW